MTDFNGVRSGGKKGKKKKETENVLFCVLVWDRWIEIVFLKVKFHFQRLSPVLAWS